MSPITNQELPLPPETTIRFVADATATETNTVASNVFYRDPSNTLRAGYWTAFGGTQTPLASHPSEFCTLLAGVVRVTPTGGEAEVYRQGDAFVIPAGFCGLWETLETCRKYFVIHDHAAD